MLNGESKVRPLHTLKYYKIFRLTRRKSLSSGLPAFSGKVAGFFGFSLTGSEKPATDGIEAHFGANRPTQA
jgi:hypothetical protein